MSADPFIHSERELALELGLQQRQLRVIRADDLSRDADWQIVKGEVRYSDAGVKRLKGLLKISSEPAPAIPAGTPAPLADLAKATGVSVADLKAAAGEAMDDVLKASDPKRRAGAIENLVCTRVYKINKRIVEAVTPAGEKVVVRMRDSTNVIPKMTMKCRFGSGRIWELAQRLPRRRGRW